MSASIINAFNKKYSDDVTHLASQMSSKLMDNVRVHRNVGGSTYDFHTMAGLAAVVRPAGNTDAVVGQNATSAVRTATLVDYELPIWAQKFDQLKTNVNQIKEYQVETVAEINRQIDRVIIAAADLATTTAGGAAAAFSTAKIRAAVKFFNDNDVDSENRVLVLSSNALVEALAIPELTSSDYGAVQVINNASIGSAFGMKWVMTNLLPKVTTTRTIYAFNKKAVGVAMGKDVSTEINYIPNHVSTLINTTVSLGAVIIDNRQIAKLSLTEA